MATPAFDPLVPVINPNDAYVQDSDQTQMYFERFMVKWTALVALADAVTFSCDGHAPGGGFVGAASGDNITGMVFADFVWGTIGVGSAGQATVWGVLRFGTQYLLLIANDDNGSPPVDITAYLASQAYALAATTDPDIKPIVVDSTRETSALTVALVPATGASNHTEWTYDAHQRSILWSKLNGADDANFAIITHRAYPSEVAADQQSFGFVFGMMPQLSVSYVNSSSYWLGHDSDGTALSTQPQMDAKAWRYSSPPGGQFANLRGRLFHIDIGANGSSTASARYYGTFYDVKGVLPNTLVNSSDPDDPGADDYTFKSIGDIAPLWLKTDGDIA